MRGGTKPKQVITHGAHKLLDTLWAKFGGPAAITKHLLPDFGRQIFVNWRNRGKVPLKFCTIVSAALEVPPWGLNYEELSMISPDKIPSWREVVKSYDFTNKEIRAILELPYPVKYKG